MLMMIYVCIFSLFSLYINKYLRNLDDMIFLKYSFLFLFLFSLFLLIRIQ